jgi:D-hydroxyproline dehydrogenase subunit beta
MRKERVVIVGAGIVGLAHAWSAAQRGHETILLERSPRAEGASIRNFGMVLLLGQPEEWVPLALVSRQRWLQLAEEAGIWVEQCGSLLLARRPEEWRVLQEFCSSGRAHRLQSHCRLLKPPECVQSSPAVVLPGLIGGLSCDADLRVDPVQALQQLPNWLQQKYGVRFEHRCSVSEVAPGRVRTSSGEQFSADRIVLCPGCDLASLYPTEFARQPLVKCKLQMMRTGPQPAAWRLGPHLAGGLSLRHYPSFSHCAGMAELKQLVAAESPELDRYGIHVMASQDSRGRIILGDSHEYGDPPEPFQSEEIDRLILRELQRMIELPNWQMESRWHGVYSKLPGHRACQFSPEPGVFVCTGLGGGGMTLAFGIAEENWQRWESE